MKRRLLFRHKGEWRYNEHSFLCGKHQEMTIKSNGCYLMKAFTWNGFLFSCSTVGSVASPGRKVNVLIPKQKNIF